MKTPSPSKIIVLAMIPAVLLIAGIVLLLSFFESRDINSPLGRGRGGFVNSSTLANQPLAVAFPAQAGTVTVDFNMALFRKGVDQFPRPTTTRPQNIKGGIVPHHDLASPLIAEFFAELSASQKPKTIILLGPNHPDLGEKAVTAQINWETRVGKVEYNNAITSELITKKIAAVDERRLEHEQSITTLIPYIAYYFPGTKIVPLIVTSKNDLIANTKLAEQLVSYLDDETLLIASIDFSHYLPSDQASRNDKVVEVYIRERNYPAIARLNSDYLDSPPSLITFLKVMDKLEARQMKIIANTDSGNLIGRDLDVSTSYFTILFSK